MNCLTGSQRNGFQQGQERQGTHGGADSASANPQSRVWSDVYHDRLQRMQETKDPALKKHFQVELDIIKMTIEAMGISPEVNGTNPSEETTGTPATSNRPTNMTA